MRTVLVFMSWDGEWETGVDEPMKMNNNWIHRGQKEQGRRYMKSIIGLILLCVSLPFLYRFFRPFFMPPPLERHGRLNVDGARLADEHGKVFDLRGVCVTTTYPDNKFINQKTFLYL